MKPKELIEKWVETFNQADAEKIAAFYHDDAINHQVANVKKAHEMGINVVLGKIPELH